MRAFAWTAYTEAGRRRTGTTVAESEADASARLAAAGLLVAEIADCATRPRRWRRARLSPELQAVFTRQMATLLAADLPVETALEAVRAGGHPALDRVGAEARARLMDGTALASALEASGAGFAPYVIAAIRAGEGAGGLRAVFAELADHLETRKTDRAQIATALVYPAFVATVALLVCALLTTTVAPEILALYARTGQPLPALSQALLTMTDAVQANAPALLAAAAALGATLAAIPHVPMLRAGRDRALLRLPVVGRLMRLQAAVQVLRTLALVLGARDAAVIAVETAVAVPGPAQFRAEGAEAAAAIRRGETLSDALSRLSLLPPVALALIRAGESSARVAPMTARAADMVDQRLSAERRRIAALLEPFLMLIVGGVVLVVVLAVLLPIFDLQAGIAP